jgi:hypothetical protein
VCWLLLILPHYVGVFYAPFKEPAKFMGGKNLDMGEILFLRAKSDIYGLFLKYMGESGTPKFTIHHWV